MKHIHVKAKKVLKGYRAVIALYDGGRRLFTFDSTTVYRSEREAITKAKKQEGEIIKTIS